MLFVYIGVASVVISLLLLFGLERLTLQKRTKTDVAVELRELLIARAEGRIDQTEFDRQQAALHIAVLQNTTESKGKSNPAYWRWVIAIAVAILVYGGIYWGTSPKDGGSYAKYASQCRWRSEYCG